MKNIIYLLVITVVLITSCSEDFLELSPGYAITSGNYFKTEAHFNEALNGTYAKLRGALNDDHSWLHGEMRSDNTHFTYGTNQPLAVINKELSEQFLDRSDFGDVYNKYAELYSVISSANLIIGKIDAVGLEASVTDPIIGQAKFIRALCYFELVRYFGGVPIYDEAVEDPDNAFIARSSVENVYEFIKSDAKEAVDKLPKPTFPQKGYASKSSARMLLGYVYITLKNYNEALTQFQEITNYGHNLLPNYASVFELENKNSRESIFELQYSKEIDKGQHNSTPYLFLPFTYDLSMIVGISPSVNIWDSGWNVPTWEMINSYEPGDERLDASIAIAEGTGTVPKFVIEAIKSPVGYSTPADKISYPYIKKLIHAHNVLKQTDDNFIIYRYAEVLLFIAESFNELNKPDEALAYINQVRNRAGLENITETSQSALRDIIVHERRIELAFENKRYQDLVRTGKAVEIMNANGVYIKNFFRQGGYLLQNGYDVTEEKLILPIPERETRIAGLKQNPGYY